MNKDIIEIRDIESEAEKHLSENGINTHLAMKFTKDGYIVGRSKGIEREKEYRDFIEQIDKSLYIGEDLSDKEILDFYIEVWKSIKEEAKQLLNKINHE